MKLIVSVVEEQDVGHVMTALTRQHIRVTHMSSTAGLLDPGKSTLLIGVEDVLVPQIMRMVADLAGPHETVVPYSYHEEPSLSGFRGVVVGGYTSFVLNVAHFEQV